jgi:cytochrome c oxidase subunit 2
MRSVRRDIAKGWQLGRQEPATPVAEGIRRFHNDRRMVMLGVTVFVTWRLRRCVMRFSIEVAPRSTQVVHGTRIEVVWTRVPARRLVRIAVPSFTLLYSVDERVEPGMTVKVVGHQWYWSYEYADVEASEGMVEFESYMRPDEERVEGGRRRLEVDKRRRRPMHTHVRRIVTAADVLHSWAVPSFGVKLDACPGRLNQVARYVTRPGVYYGQCSEICGVNHGFMPILVEVRPVAEYRSGRVGE